MLLPVAEYHNENSFDFEFQFMVSMYTCRNSFGIMAQFKKRLSINATG